VTGVISCKKKSYKDLPANAPLQDFYKQHQLEENEKAQGSGMAHPPPEGYGLYETDFAPNLRRQLEAHEWEESDWAGPLTIEDFERGKKALLNKKWTMTWGKFDV
jgi:hypothetical protein